MKTSTVKIGQLYFPSNYFNEESAKTIGQPLVGDMDTILRNRNNIEGKILPKGKVVINQLKHLIKFYIPDVIDVKISWSKHCGCSMCPCSPGFEVKIVVDRSTNLIKNTEDRRFNLWINKNGSIDYRSPKDFSPFITEELGKHITKLKKYDHD